MQNTNVFTGKPLQPERPHNSRRDGAPYGSITYDFFIVNKMVQRHEGKIIWEKKRKQWNSQKLQQDGRPNHFLVVYGEKGEEKILKSKISNF